MAAPEVAGQNVLHIDPEGVRDFLGRSQRRQIRGGGIDGDMPRFGIASPNDRHFICLVAFPALKLVPELNVRITVMAAAAYRDQSIAVEGIGEIPRTAPRAEAEGGWNQRHPAGGHKLDIHQGCACSQPAGGRGRAAGGDIAHAVVQAQLKAELEDLPAASAEVGKPEQGAAQTIGVLLDQAVQNSPGGLAAMGDILIGEYPRRGIAQGEVHEVNGRLQVLFGEVAGVALPRRTAAALDQRYVAARGSGKAGIAGNHGGEGKAGAYGAAEYKDPVLEPLLCRQCPKLAKQAAPRPFKISGQGAKGGGRLLPAVQQVVEVRPCRPSVEELRRHKDFQCFGIRLRIFIGRLDGPAGELDARHDIQALAEHMKPPVSRRRSEAGIMVRARRPIYRPGVDLPCDKLYF